MLQLLFFVGYINIAFKDFSPVETVPFFLKIITWLLCVNTNKPKPKAVV